MELQRLIGFLEELCPPKLAEEWDNTGLLIGSRETQVDNVLTCLTLTSDVAAEALQQQVQLIVTHHPVLFRAVKKLTDETSEGRMLLSLIQAGVCVYSPHTSYDSAGDGINRQIAQELGLSNVRPLRPSMHDPEVGSGRMGDLTHAMSLEHFAGQVKSLLGVKNTWLVGETSRRIERVAIACGAAAEFLRDAAALDCDVLLTGEARFHACLEAKELDIALVLPGHYATERPAMETLAHLMQRKFPTLTVFASEVERDPIQWM